MPDDPRKPTAGMRNAEERSPALVSSAGNLTEKPLSSGLRPDGKTQTSDLSAPRPRKSNIKNPTSDIPFSPVAAVLGQASMVDFPGRLAAVFFVGGCNFRCGFCHNAGLLVRPPAYFTWAAIRARAAEFRRSWADGAVISGGEPTLSPGLSELIAELKRQGFAVKLDTNGSRPDALAAVLGMLDYVAMDVKTAPDRYAALTGFGDTDAIARSMALLRAGATEYELRTTVIEGEHDDATMEAMGAWLCGARRWVLQPFVPREDLPDPALRSAPRTPLARLRELRDRMAGFADEMLVRGE